MSGTQPPLPEDIVEYLRIAEREFGDRRAMELLAAYRPKPETLADHGTIIWTRIFRLRQVGIFALSRRLWTEDDAPRGFMFQSDVWVPWPEIEGINPADLLNDGWQIRAFGDVPDGWHVYQTSTKDTAFASFRKENGNVRQLWSNGVVVFCRPPQGEDT